MIPETTTRGGERTAPAPTAALWRVFAAMLVSWVVLAAATYGKADVTTRDFERLDNLWLSAFYLALFAVLLVAYARLAESEPGPPARAAWMGFVALALSAALAFPVGSKDVFFYVFYGKMWGAYGANPHVHAPAEFAGDAWFRFLQVWTNEQTTPYGPLFSLQMRLVYALCGGDVATAIALQKAFNVLLAGIAAWLLGELQRDVLGSSTAERAHLLALWLWSPLVLFESAGAAHNDLGMTVLLLAAVLLWTRERPGASAAALTLAFWYKWYALVLAPLWLLRSLRRWGWGRWLQTSALGAASLSAIVLLPFLASLGPMLGRLAAFHGLREIFPDELPPPLWLLFHGLQAMGLDGAPGRAWFDTVRAVAFVAGLAWFAWRAPLREQASAAFVCDVFWSLLLFFSVVPTMLWPWHLVPLCAFALVAGGRRYERAAVAFTAAGLLSYFLTFAYAAAGCGMIAAALWWLRRSPNPPPQPARS